MLASFVYLFMLFYFHFAIYQLGSAVQFYTNFDWCLITA